MENQFAKTVEEAREMRDKAESDEQNFSGMTYQQGIAAGIEWVLNGGDNPLE